MAGEEDEGDEGPAVPEQPTQEALSDRSDRKALARGVRGVLDFFGAAGGGRPTTRAALDAARKLGPIRYCRPGDPPWSTPEAPGARFFTLGPPHDEKAIKRLMVKSEVYGTDDGPLAASFFHRLGATVDTENMAGLEERLEPFEPEHRMDLKHVQELTERAENADSPLVAFFRDHYFKPEPWRRIDDIWLDAAQDFAIKLDNATNNTSLVLAIELDDRDVLLFAADAQVGSWLTWQDLSWKVEGRKVTGPDLLARTVFYKVGHHGSHNATLREKGLEQMTSGKLVAFIPVDEAMAREKGWGRMPLPKLVEALEKQTNDRVARSDQSPRHGEWVTETPLYFQYDVW